MARSDDDPDTVRQGERRQVSPEERRRRFAAAITRAEFGRFYWNDALEQEMRAGSRRGGKSGRGRSAPG